MKKAESNTHKSEKAAEVPSAAAETAATDLPVAAELTPEQLEELKARAAKADDHWDRLLRTAADLENFKKRAARERIEAAQSATAALIQKMLPVLDHFEMAQTATQTAEAPPGGIASLQAGVAMIQQQLKNALAESGLEEIDASGKPFDPTLHEAVSQHGNRRRSRRPRRPAAPQRLQTPRPAVATGHGDRGQKTRGQSLERNPQPEFSRWPSAIIMKSSA